MTMFTKLGAVLIALSASVATPALAADYMPVGPQTNVALSTVTGGGWSQCYSATMGTPFGSSASTTLANCTGDRIMLAGRATGSDTLLALAQAARADVFFDTGAANNGVFHEANGSNWFYADNWSWGFLTAGQTMQKFQCAFNAPDASMCVHTLTFSGGYSINQIVDLNTSSAYEKMVFQFMGTGGGVPEPATWALMILGMGAVGAAMRRRRTSVAFA